MPEPTTATRRVAHQQEADYITMQARCHPACIACRNEKAGGLGLRFSLQADGSVIAGFPCEPQLQGYPDRLHGGIVATLLDAAMTHCLFAHGIRAVTARLNIRYHHPVTVECAATVLARIEKARTPHFQLTSSISQRGIECASAEGTFLLEA